MSVSFCTLADVKAYNKNRLYDNNSKPTKTEVETQITIKSTRIEEALNTLGIELASDFTSQSLRDCIAMIVSMWSDATNIAKGVDRVKAFKDIEMIMRSKIDNILKDPKKWGIDSDVSGVVASDWDGTTAREYEIEKGENNW